MNRLKSIFHPEWYKLICITVCLFASIPLFSYAITPFLKVFHLYTLAVLAVDFFGERRLFRNKGRWLLLFFVLFYGITLITNLNLLNFSGISDFGYVFAALSVLYSYGDSDGKKPYAVSAFICSLLSLCNAIGVWMFFTKFFHYDKQTDAFIGMYVHENRLCGVWGNPAVQGMTSFIGICLALILAFTTKKAKWRVTLGVMVFINFFTMLLSNARASIYSFVLLCTVFAFICFIKHKKTFGRFCLSAVASVLVAVTVFGLCKASQFGISLIDYGHDEYLQNIDEDFDKDDDDDKKRPSIGRFDAGLNGRGELWQNGLVLILDKPVFGHGLNNINHALEQNDIEPMEISGNLHNVYIDVLVACGILGFILLAGFLMIMFGNVKKVIKYTDDSMYFQVAITASCVTGFMLYGMVDSSMMFSMYPTSLIFWYIVAHLARLTESANRKSGHHRTEPLQLLEEKYLQKRNRNTKSICFVNDSLGGGGAEQILVNVSGAMAEKGYDVTVLTLWADGELESKLDSSITLKTADPFDFKILKRIQHWINRHCMPKRFYNFLFLDRRYDFTVAFLEGLSTILVSSTKICDGDKKFAWVHIDFKEQNWTLPFYRNLNAQIESYRVFDSIFCVSETVKSAFNEVIGYPEKTIVQHNLVDTRKVEAKSGEACPETRPDGLLLCSVGRLNPQKGYDRLINAVARLKNAGIECKLWILGEGDIRDDLERQIKDLGLENDVSLLGFKENPFCYSALADVFVCSSRAEGYSTVITENLILGKAIVSTLCAGVREQLGDNEYGIVTENNEDALFEGLYKMLSDGALREHYAKMAKERSREITYDIILNQYSDIFS